MAFGDTAYGDFLTRKASDSGVVRKEATKAVGYVTVKGNGELPKGSQFATQTGVLFETLDTVAVDKVATVKVEAAIPGVIGNVTAQAISVIPMSIPGILSVSNAEPMQDGFEAETDEELRTRYLNHVRNPGTSGNINHYYEWAMSVAGVGGAKVIPTWNGAGTVKVIVVDTEYKAASTEIVTKVQTYIDKVRPMGAVVAVKTVEPTTINISIHPEGAFNLDVFKELVKAYFIDLEQQIIKGGQMVKLSLPKIGSLALDAGAIDYTGLLVNGRAESVTLRVDQLAVLGEVQAV